MTVVEHSPVVLTQSPRSASYSARYPQADSHLRESYSRSLAVAVVVTALAELAVVVVLAAVVVESFAAVVVSAVLAAVAVLVQAVAVVVVDLLHLLA